MSKAVGKHLTLHAAEMAAPLVTKASALAAKMHYWGQWFKAETGTDVGPALFRVPTGLQQQ